MSFTGFVGTGINRGVFQEQSRNGKFTFHKLYFEHTYYTREGVVQQVVPITVPDSKYEEAMAVPIGAEIEVDAFVKVNRGFINLRLSTIRVVGKQDNSDVGW